MKKLIITICLGLCLQTAFAQNAAPVKEEYCMIVVGAGLMGKQLIELIKPNGEVVEIEEVKASVKEPFKHIGAWMQAINKLASEGWIAVNVTERVILMKRML